MPRKDGLESLQHKTGKRFWRSLEELAETEEFQESLRREFPEAAVASNDAPSRRDFLKLMGASLALAGLHGCGRQPEEEIVPYVEQPEEVVPGKPLFFATAHTLGGFAEGVLIESHMGRPTKVEGNAEHPASRGATDVFAQASVLNLYDPDRSQVPTRLGAISTWRTFLSGLEPQIEAQRSKEGTGLRILTETVTSPTLADQLRQFRDAFPQAKWHQYEPVHRDNVRAGARLAFGEDAHTVYHFDRADAVLALDADFLGSGPGHLRYARDFMGRRNVQQSENSDIEMDRLYVAESTPTLTGAKADHRLSLKPSHIEGVARAVAAKLGVPGIADAERPPGVSEAWIDAVVDDLRNYRLPNDPGASLVIAGEAQPPVVHALAHAMNDALGNVGETVTYTEPVEARPTNQTNELRELADDLRNDEVDLLLILGGNPVFNAPVDLKFGEALTQARLGVHLSRFEDETSELCHWHIPEAHPLETWGDARAYDGTATIQQPLIAPLYNGRSAHELLSAILDETPRSAHEVVRDDWRQRYEAEHGGKNESAEGFEAFWRTSLHDGVARNTEAPTKNVTLRSDFLDGIPQSSMTADGLEIVFRPDPTIGDGRFANNGWLQELPKPFSKLTWDNAALISPATAEEYALAKGDMVEIEYAGRALTLPVWIQPGHPDETITVHFGHGRWRAGRVGTGTGFNVYRLRSSETPWFGTGATLRKTGERYDLASTQHHFLMEGRDLVRAGTLEEFRANPEHPEFVETGHGGEHHASLYPEHEYDGYKWGMAIDLGACIGCNACVTACQAENNIPVVGKEQVKAGREMHWIRVDNYYEGEADHPRVHHQPVPCMHCENAPCEPVCPVAATTHSDEGLNEMTYNRCVGTRYCSNNCPYKVRRFNYFGYTADYDENPSLKLLQNPDVTVRSRGVMEKCTYCVQRINSARIDAEKRGDRIRDGEVVTACQAACPTQAIRFGDLNDPDSDVRRAKDHPLDYALLGELNTRPRTTYSAALRNPNPKLES